VKVWEFRRGWRENSLFCTLGPSPSIAAARKYWPFYDHNQILSSQIGYRVHSIFYEFIVNSNTAGSLNHTMAIKRHLEDDKIDRKPMCKKCNMGMCILGCFEEYHTKVRFSYMTRRGGGVEAYIYNKQTTKKVCALNFTIFKNNYLGLCMCFYWQCVNA
jgi:hypothetical protein